MNLTYIIGNGFDLGLGLRTSYKDFLRYYLNSRESLGDLPIVQSFKEMIRTDEDSWGDAEKAMGALDYERFSCYDNMAQVGNLSSIHDDFAGKLKEYILKQEQLFLRRIHKLDRQDFRDIAREFRNSLALINLSLCNHELGNVFYLDCDVLDVNFISFNYTKTLEILLAGEKTEQQVISGMDVRFHAPYHVHGKTDDEEIIFGVSDESQIAFFNRQSQTGRVELKDDIVGEFLRQVLVKPDVDNVRNNGRDVRSALDCLNQSDVIVLMGSSIGATDSFWWGAIVKEMEKRPSMKLVWVSYHPPSSDNMVSDTKARNEFEKSERRCVTSRLARAFGDGYEDCEMLRRFSGNIFVTGCGPFADPDGELRYFDPLKLGWIGKRCSLA